MFSNAQKRYAWDNILYLLKRQCTVTTLEIKNECRVTHPDENWTQSDMSIFFAELVNEGYLSIFADNGVHRIYNRTGLIPCFDDDPVDDAVSDDPADQMSATPTVQPVTATVPVATPKPRLVKKTVSKTKVLDLIDNTIGGRFFSVTFIKKNGEERKMNCKKAAGAKPNRIGHLLVKDCANGGQHRQINLQTLKSLTFDNTFYRVRT